MDISSKMNKRETDDSQLVPFNSNVSFNVNSEKQNNYCIEPESSVYKPGRKKKNLETITPSP